MLGAGRGSGCGGSCSGGLLRREPTVRTVSFAETCPISFSGEPHVKHHRGLGNGNPDARPVAGRQTGAVRPLGRENKLGCLANSVQGSLSLSRGIVLELLNLKWLLAGGLGGARLRATRRHRDFVMWVVLFQVACVSVCNACMHAPNPSLLELPGVAFAPVLDREFRRPNPWNLGGILLRRGARSSPRGTIACM